VGAAYQTATSRDGPSCTEKTEPAEAQVACLGRLAVGETRRAARHLSARVAGGIESGTWRRCMSDDDLYRLPRVGAFSKKKTLIASEQDRPDVAEKRAQWRTSQEELHPDQVVFIDETWAKTNMTRRYGRAPVGTRLVEKTPCGRWQTTTFLGALRAKGFVAPLTVDGAINGELFRAWVQQHLAPTLQPGDIVVMDNLSSHKDSQARQMIINAGALIWDLPPYSPDFNPIEEMWSKVKALLRKAKARTPEALFHAIAEALRKITKDDCIGWFKHRGYL